ncbi:MAG: nickel-dependent lactate racemase [Termitinemataceae bacterium]|nr:MAG: nickel-dependent lactate racemase [Termitinemataceae bacterium]
MYSALENYCFLRKNKKMKIEIPYLQKSFPLEFPDENLLAIAEPLEFKTAQSGEDALNKALLNPVGCEALSDFLNGAKRLLIIINDATRPTPTPAMLNALLPHIKAAGIPPENQTLLVATGAHRVPTEDEYKQILGTAYSVLRPRCIAHDSKNESETSWLGVTRNGTPVALNNALFKADRIIITGSVEPHYFAGFTGGRKAFLPGIAAFRTIEANHKQALSPAAHSLALDGNPVHEDMMDALAFINIKIFSLMTVLDKEQNIASAFAGDILKSFYDAVDCAKQIFCVPVSEKADIVISVAKFPMDIDLYQSQKAIDNGACALKDGGTLILVSSCRCGIGDEAYAGLLASSSSPENAISRIECGYKLGYHKAAKMAEVSKRATICAVTGLPKERLASMFIESAASVQEAFDAAMLRAGNNGVLSPKILVLPDGCVTVPDTALS